MDNMGVAMSGRDVNNDSFATNSSSPYATIEDRQRRVSNPKAMPLLSAGGSATVAVAAAGSSRSVEDGSGAGMSGQNVKLNANFMTQGMALFEKRFIVAKRNVGLTMCQLFCPAMLSFMTLFFLLRSIQLTFVNLPLTPEANYNQDFFPVDERNSLPYLATGGSGDKNLMANGGWMDEAAITSGSYGFGGSRVEIKSKDKECPWS